MKLIVQRRHPIRNVLPAAQPRHVRERLGTEIGLVRRGSEEIDAPAQPWQQSLEIVRRQSLEMEAVDVVPPDSNMNSRAPGLVARCSACRYCR